MSASDEPRRPDPDALLARAAREEGPGRRGRLTVFFGASPGVGKTYAMLRAARARREEGVDVLVCVVETHGRSETAVLLEGLPTLPRRRVEHRGIVLEELDLDGLLARRPGLAVVDELAHANVPGSRHPKRWQDVEEILAAGIDVLTTLNVQHVESLNDVVAQVTGVVVRETVPDAVLDLADEVLLVDLPPAELLRRLKEGKVYLGERAERALSRFFQEGNLIALRELALRRTAERVDAEYEDWRSGQVEKGAWKVSERLLVCVGPSPFSARIVRAARRMAAGLQAPWIAAYVKTPASARLSADDRARAEENLRLAQRLGAEVVTVEAPSVATALLSLARERRATKIVVGKPSRRGLIERLRGSLVDALVLGSGDVDVYVITGDRDAPAPRPPPAPPPVAPASGLLGAVVITAACTAAGAVLDRQGYSDTVVMVYLLGVLLAAWRLGRAPSVVVSLLGVAAFDYFFVPPHLTFAVADVRHLLTFAVLLLVGLVVSALTSRLRDEAMAASARERRTVALHALSREFASRRGREVLLPLAARHAGEALGGTAVVVVAGPAGALGQAFDAAGPTALQGAEVGLARWTIDRGLPSGRGTETLPGVAATAVPLTASRGVLGALLFRPGAEAPPLGLEALRLLEAFAAQTAAALERTLLADEGEKARVEVESERLRNALLSSVSHDLRTPLAGILGAASGIEEGGDRLDAPTRADLARGIRTEAERLERLLGDLLEMTRLDAGVVRATKHWQPLEEVIGSALTRLERRLAGRPVRVDLPPDLPMVPLDEILIEQVLVNLVENALKHAPQGSPIEVSARLEAPDRVVVRVADRGPGFPAGEEDRVFEKFHRAAAPGVPGTGLGLSVCRGIVSVHGGTIRAFNREGGGAVVEFTIPLEGVPPGAAPEAPEGPP